MKNELFLKKYMIQFIDMVMIILGCLGILGNYLYSLYFPLSVILSLFFLCVIGVIFYGYYVKKQKMPRKIFFAILTGLLIMLVVLFQNELRYFIQMLQTVIERDYFLKFEELLPEILNNQYLFFQIIFLFMGLPIVYLIVSCVCSVHFSFIKIMILLFLFQFPVFIRHELIPFYSYCFVIFICFQFMFAVVLKYQRQQHKLKLIFLSVLCFMSFIASLYLEDNPIFQQDTTSVLSQMSDWFSHGKGNPFGIIMQTGMSSDIDGSLPTGNIRLNSGLALTVKSNVPFSSYLRAYSLANYEDNEWHEVSENYEDSHSITLYGQFLALNYLPSFISVEIESQRRYDYQFVPYYFFDSDNQYSMLYDSYIERTDSGLDVLYKYEKDPSFELDDDTYYIFDQYDYQYEKYVNEQYMSVPENLDKQLTDILNNNTIEFSSRFDVPLAVEHVRRILDNYADYDLNAGTLPPDKDFVEYFLFENHKGSCTHFATAGALLLRKLGIPTRYVRGYIMKESDFQNGEAKIPQYRSHAWIEVFENGKGWIPYEMTPAGDLEGISEVLDDTVRQNQQTSNDPNSTTVQSNQSDTQDITNPVISTQEPNIFVQNIDNIFKVSIVCLILIAYRYLTTHWLSIKTKNMNNNQRVLVYYRQRWKLSPQHKIDDEKFLAIAYKTKYSLHEISDEEWQYYYKMYQEWIDDYYQTLKWYKKIIFRYIFGYK